MTESIEKQHVVIDVTARNCVKKTLGMTMVKKIVWRIVRRRKCKKDYGEEERVELEGVGEIEDDGAIKGMSCFITASARRCYLSVCLYHHTATNARNPLALTASDTL